jgi:hypothetical protein
MIGVACAIDEQRLAEIGDGSDERIATEVLDRRNIPSETPEASHIRRERIEAVVQVD